MTIQTQSISRASRYTRNLLSHVADLEVCIKAGRFAELAECIPQCESIAHMTRVGEMAGILGALAGCGPETVALLRNAAPLHDLGKLAIPPEILQKPGPLTPEEFAVVQGHAAMGHWALAQSDAPILKYAAEVSLTHHERFDGSGYPRGLHGHQIPLAARIVSLVDAMDALLSKRVYKSAFSVEQTVTIIVQDSGSHFDPKLTALLLANLPRVLRVYGAPHSPDFWIGMPALFAEHLQA